MQEFLSVKQVALMFSVHKYTVMSWCRAGKIKAIQPGGKWLIPASQFESQLIKPEETGNE